MMASDLKAPDVAVPDISPVTDQIEIFGEDKPAEKKVQLTTVYKWQDENGGWHFSNKADPSHPAEEVMINNNTNTVSMPAPEKHEGEHRPYHSRDIVKNQTNALDADASPYGQLPNLIDKAKDVDNVLEQRRQKQEKLLSEIGN